MVYFYELPYLTTASYVLLAERRCTLCILNIGNCSTCLIERVIFIPLPINTGLADFKLYLYLCFNCVNYKSLCNMIRNWIKRSSWAHGKLRRAQHSLCTHVFAATNWRCWFLLLAAGDWKRAKSEIQLECRWPSSPNMHKMSNVTTTRQNQRKTSYRSRLYQPVDDRLPSRRIWASPQIAISERRPLVRWRKRALAPIRAPLMSYTSVTNASAKECHFMHLHGQFFCSVDKRRPICIRVYRFIPLATLNGDIGKKRWWIGGDGEYKMKGEDAV